MAEQQRVALGDAVADLGLPDVVVALVGDEHHHDVAARRRVGDRQHLEAAVARLLRPRGVLAQPDDDVDPGVLEVQRVGVALRAEADDGDGLAVEQPEVSVVVVVHGRRSYATVRGRAGATRSGAPGSAAVGAGRRASFVGDDDARPQQRHQRDDVEAEQDHREQQEQPHRREARAGAEVQPDDGRDRLDGDPGRHGAVHARAPVRARARRPVVEQGEDEDRADGGDHDEQPARQRAAHVEGVGGVADHRSDRDRRHDHQRDAGPERHVADAAGEHVVACAFEDPRLAALDDADGARRRPQHRDQRDRQQQRRVVARAEHQPADVAVDGLGEEAVERVDDAERRLGVAEQERLQGGQAEATGASERTR